MTDARSSVRTIRNQRVHIHVSIEIQHFHADCVYAALHRETSPDTKLTNRPLIKMPLSIYTDQSAQCMAQCYATPCARTMSRDRASLSTSP